MNPQHPLLTSLVQPQDHLRMEAIKERIDSDGSRSGFQKWLQSQGSWDLKWAIKENETSAQEFLYQQVGDISRQIPSYLVSVALVMIAKSGWDTQLMQGFEDESRNSSWVATDETFLEWLTVHEGYGTFLPEGLNWPNTLQEFIAFDNQHKPPRNHEWLTALFIASGANPWTMAREERRNLALQNSILRGHPKICTLLLSLPNAPSLRDELDRTHCFDEKDNISTRLFGISQHTANAQSQKFLPIILQDSLKLKLTPQEMARATPTVLKKYLENHSHTPKEISETEEQLNINHKDGWFGAIGLVERLALLPKNQHWPHDLTEKQARVLTEHLILSEREDLYNSACHKEQQSKGVNWLTLRSNFGGPQEGCWSLFNAFLFYKIKHSDNLNGNLGTYGFHFNHWLLDPPEDEFFDRREIKRTYPELSSLLHEDLGNGLPVHGLWTLCFLGKTYREKTEDSKENQDLTKKPSLIVTGLETESKVLGISDWKTFFESGRKPAVEATEWIVAMADDKNVTSTRQSLTIVWARCLQRFPTWMDDHPDLMTRVLQTLSPGQCLTWENLNEWPSLDHWSFGAWNRVLMHVHNRPQWLPSDTPFKSKTPAEQELVLEMLLGTHHPSDLDRVSEILEQPIALPERVLSWLYDWEATQGGITEKQKTSKGYALELRHLNRFKSALLNRRLPPAAEEPKQARF